VVVQTDVMVVAHSYRPAVGGHLAGHGDVPADRDEDPAPGRGGGPLGGPVGGEGPSDSGEVQGHALGQCDGAGRLIDPDPAPLLVVGGPVGQFGRVQRRPHHRVEGGSHLYGGAV